MKAFFNKRLVTFFIAGIVLTNMFAQSGYVGESIYLSAPSVQGTIDGAAWISSSDCVSVSGNHYGATATINSYFTGTVTIDLQYAYSYYSGSKKYYQNAHAYYNISCKASQVTLDKNRIALKLGQTTELTYQNSSGFELPFMYWFTSDKKVASIDYSEYAYGEKTITVVPIGVGECVITAEGHTGRDAPTCTVIVTADPPTGISLSPDRMQIGVGKKGRFSYKLTPSDAYSEITWTSSNESIAIVNSSGVITGVSDGTAIITAKTENGYFATGTVEVIPLPNSVSLPSNIYSAVGYTTKITPIFSPSNADCKLAWESSDPTTASINSSGYVKGKKTGTVQITVKTENDKSASCDVVIKEAPMDMDARNMTIRVNALKELINKSLKNIE